jgi:hypothetical protein
MHASKTVTVHSYSPLAVRRYRRKFPLPWTDLWLSFRIGPGKPTQNLAPCLVSRQELVKDLEFERFSRNDPKNLPESHAEKDRQIAEYEEILQKIDANGVAILNGDLYTRRNDIDFAEAEAMLRYLMASLGYNKVKFRWKDPGPRRIAIPIGTPGINS